MIQPGFLLISITAMNVTALSITSPAALQKTLPNLVSAVCAILIAYILANTVWLFVGGRKPLAEIPAVLPQGADIQASSNGEEYASRVQQLHLFGKANVSLETANAPETQLNLKLVGVLAIGVDGGMAIIGNGNNEDVYVVGDTIPGGVTLKGVYYNHVLLQSSRGLETLRLPESDAALIEFTSTAKTGATPESAGFGSPQPAQSAAAETRTLRDLRRDFIRNPASLAEYAQAEPVENTGYRLNLIQENPMFQKLGLQSGDVVTSVNDIPLDKPENGIRALRKLMKAREVRLTILRNGQEQQLSSPLE
ncbi:MAG TPA: type II secretion system protein N [Gammaproteobacteria bacterium]